MHNGDVVEQTQIYRISGKPKYNIYGSSLMIPIPFYMYTRRYICTYVYISIYVYKNACIYIHMHACIYICMYTYIYLYT